MRHTYRSLSIVSKAYVLSLERYNSMELETMFKWMGFTSLGVIVLWLTIIQCRKYCQRRYKCGAENVEVVIPSTCSTSSSFTYVPSSKVEYNLPLCINDGLSDFDNSIMCDQSTALCGGESHCVNKSYPIPKTMIDRSLMLGNRGSLDDDLNSIQDMINVFNNSVLSLTMDDFDNMYGNVYVDRNNKMNSEIQQNMKAVSSNNIEEYSSVDDIESHPILRNARDLPVLMHCELVTDV